MSSISQHQFGRIFLILWGLSLLVGCQSILTDPATPTGEPSSKVTSTPLPVYFLGDGQTAPGWAGNGTIQWRQNNFGTFELGPDNYEIGIDRSVSHSGGQSGFIRGLSSEFVSPGQLIQTIAADSYRGRRVKFSAYLKTESVEFIAGAGAVVFDADYQPINAYEWRYTNFSGTNDWQRTDFVLDVPEEAAYLSLLAALAGKGAVWVDDWSAEIVEDSVPITTAYDFNNPSFEKFNNNIPTGWFQSGSRPLEYEIGQGTQYVQDGQFSATIKAEAADANEFTTLMQVFPAKPYWGQRLRLSGFMKSELLENGATMWMRVDGPPGKMLRFDNTGYHEGGMLQGSTDWRLQTIILDVPEGSRLINLGFILSGNGQIWIDDVVLEKVEADIRSTASANSSEELQLALPNFLKDPSFSESDLGASIDGWFGSGTQLAAYEMGVDSTVGRSDSQSGYVKYTGEGIGLGTLVQAVQTDRYRGERVKVRAYIRTENSDQLASFWMRVTSDTLLELATVPLPDSTDWQLQELTLDIPEDSLTMSFGITNAGTGSIWIDDLELFPVETSIPATNWFDATELTNLGFEERPE